MKYEVITDINGYVQIIRHTGTIRDFVELNLDDYDLSENRLHAYRLGKNKLIFDETRYEQILNELNRQANIKEVATLKSYLNDTDYIIARAFEEVLALNNPITYVADVIKIQIKYTKMYKNVLAERVKARARIEELENEEV